MLLILVKCWSVSPTTFSKAKNFCAFSFSAMSLCMSLQWVFRMLNPNLLVTISETSLFTQFERIKHLCGLKEGTKVGLYFFKKMKIRHKMTF